MDTRDWHILWGVPPKYDNESNGALDDNATLAANVFYASALNVILQRLMPLYRLRQTGESTTLLLKATHIDIATAMALWILGIGTSCGVCLPSMTTKVIIKTGCLLLQPAQACRNSDSVRRCDGIFKRRVHNST